MNYKHGHAVGGKVSSTYASWAHMMQRCYDENFTELFRYGAVGVEVAKEWHEFTGFLKDMGERPVGKTLERKDFNGHYTKTNCTWATPAEQARNRSTTRLTLEQVEELRRLYVPYRYTQARLARQFGVSRECINMVVNGYNWK